MLAAQAGHAAVLEVLQKIPECDVNVQVFLGDTALSLAARSKQAEVSVICIRQLLKALAPAEISAAVCKRNHSGCMPCSVQPNKAT